MSETAYWEDDDTCPECWGEGGWHDCGEDCCCCLRPAINETCGLCEGTGTWISRRTKGEQENEKD